MSEPLLDRRTALRLGLAGMLATPLVATACGGGSREPGALETQARRRSVGIAVASPYAPWPALQSALATAGTAAGASLSFADEALDARGQEQALERWSGRNGLGAVLVTPVAASVVSAATAAARSGTPVVGLLADVPGQAGAVRIDLATAAAAVLDAVDARWRKPASVLLIRPTNPSPVPLPFAAVAGSAADALRARLASRRALAAELTALAAADAEPTVAAALADRARIRLVVCVDDGVAAGVARAVEGTDVAVACLAPAGATDPSTLRALAAARGAVRVLAAPRVNQLAQAAVTASLRVAAGRRGTTTVPILLAEPGSAEARALRRAN